MNRIVLYFIIGVALYFAPLKAASDNKKPAFTPTLDSILVKSYLDSAWNNYNLNFSKMFYFSTKALIAAQKIGYLDGVANARKMMGNYYNMVGDPHKAIGQFNLALAHFESKLMKNDMALVYKNIAISYARTAQLDSAMTWGLKAKVIFDELNSLPDIAQTLGLLGSICNEANEKEKALGYFLQSQKIFRELGNEDRINSLNMFIGSYYTEKNIPDSALHYLSQAFEYYKTTRPSDVNYAEASHFLGQISLKKNRLQEAESYFKAGLKATAILGPTIETGILLNMDMAELAMKTNNTTSALNYARIAEQVAKNHPAYLPDVYKLFYQIYKKSGHTDEALAYHEKYRTLYDSLTEKKNYNVLMKLEAKYQNESKAKQIELLNKDKENYHLSRKFYFAVIGATIVLLVIALVLAMVTRKRYLYQRALLEQEKTINNLHEVNFEQEKLLIEKDRQILKNELEIKNAELLALSASVTRNNELNMKFLKQIRKLVSKREIPVDSAAELNAVIQEMEQNTAHGSWTDVRKRFTALHPAFIENLNRAVPDLSRTEVQLAMLIRMNLTAKDIASLTMQSANSVYVARFRFRKKLNIEEDDKLYNFLLSIAS